MTEQEEGKVCPLSWKSCLSGFAKRYRPLWKAGESKKRCQLCLPLFITKRKKLVRLALHNAAQITGPLHCTNAPPTPNMQRTARVNLPLPSILQLLFRLAQLTLCHLTRRIITRGRPRHVTEWGQMVNGAGSGARVKKVRISSWRLWSYLEVFRRVTRCRDGSAFPYLPLRPVADPSTLPSTHPTPGQTQQAPAFTHQELLWCASSDSCLQRSLEGLFCKRNLNLHPLEDPRPTFSLWQTGSWTVHPLGLRTHLLTVVIHPLGAAGKQWNLLLRERLDYFASSRKACFHSRLEVKSAVKTEITFLSGRTIQKVKIRTLISRNLEAVGLLFRANNFKGL